MPIKLITFGCRLNTYESEVIKTFLQEEEAFKTSDIIIFNSCTVTSEAEKQLRQAIRKARKDNPKSIIGIVGCAAQTNKDVYKNMPEVDFVFGNKDKMQKNNYGLLIPIIKEIESHKTCKCNGKCSHGTKSCSCNHNHDNNTNTENSCECGYDHNDCNCNNDHQNEESCFDVENYNSDLSSDSQEYDEVDYKQNVVEELDFDSDNIEKPILVSNISELTEFSSQLITGFEGIARGFVQVQNGCDNHCTFCATRLARGRSISVPSIKIIEQINKLIENGYNEIVLTGIDITDYGKRLNEDLNLGKLMKKILKETDLKQLRLSSLDIADINDDLKDVLFNESRVMPHIHISLQSGDNTILKRMARRHNREQVIEFCNEIKKYRKNISIGADLIAGFPTETEIMHKNSCKLVEEVGIVFGHIFPYSIRENTPAALMEQIPMETRRRRAKELRELSNKQLENFTKEQMLLDHKVLIENDKVGRTQNFLTVNLDPEIIKTHKVGEIIDFKY